jgi:uncharacterized MnhB-related membrane protein
MGGNLLKVSRAVLAFICVLVFLFALKLLIQGDFLNALMNASFGSALGFLLFTLRGTGPQRGPPDPEA